jgi:hypothetical protein
MSASDDSTTRIVLAVPSVTSPIAAVPAPGKAVPGPVTTT